MSKLPIDIYKKWAHSFEEDNEVHVYRPAQYEFPRARGRDGIEFKQDGTFVDWVVGPGHANRANTGKWQVNEEGNVKISFEDNTKPPLNLKILYCDSTVLKLQRR